MKIIEREAIVSWIAHHQNDQNGELSLLQAKGEEEEKIVTESGSPWMDFVREEERYLGRFGTDDEAQPMERVMHA
jgi:hypothetical protein